MNKTFIKPYLKHVLKFNITVCTIIILRHLKKEKRK